MLAGREMHRLRGAADTAAAVKQAPRPEAVAGVLQLERQRPSSCYDAHDVEVAGLLACWAGGLLHAARAYESSVEQASLPSYRYIYVHRYIYVYIHNVCGAGYESSVEQAR